LPFSYLLDCSDLFINENESSDIARKEEVRSGIWGNDGSESSRKHYVIEYL